MSEPEPNLTDFPRDGPGFDNLADPLDERDRETGFVVGIDHVQIAVPANSEKACRDFYLGVLGLVERQNQVDAYNSDHGCPPISQGGGPAYCSGYVSSANTWGTG